MGFMQAMVSTYQPNILGEIDIGQPNITHGILRIYIAASPKEAFSGSWTSAGKISKLRRWVSDVFRQVQ